MRRLLALLALLPTTALAAPLSWEWLSPRPTAERLLDVAVGQTEDKKDLVYAVGAHGVLLASQDQGETWELHPTGVKATLFDVAFIEQGKGYYLPFIVGDSGTILKGSYDGKTWTPLTSGIKVALRSIWGANGNLYAAGDKGTLLVSEDSGLTWKAVKTGVKESLSSIATSATGELYIAGTGGVLLYSADGKKWVKKKQGLQWKNKEVKEESPKLRITDAGDLILSGAGGILLRSTNKGKTWEGLSVGGNPKQDCAQYLVSSNAELLCSSDNTSWGTQDTGKGLRPLAVAWLDPKRAYAVGEAGLTLVSGDQGKTWEKKSKAESGTLRSVWGVSHAGSATELYAVGQNGHISYSSDAGQSWTLLNSGTTANLNAIWGANDRILAAGDGGTLLRSSDKGKTWTPIELKTKENLKALWGSGTEMYAVGVKSTVLHSFTSGDTWSQILDTARTDFQDAWGTSADNVFLVGSNSGTALVLHSSDGGSTWGSTAFGNPSSLDAIGGDGSKNVFGVSQRLLLRSPDTGNTWSTQITTLLSTSDGVSTTDAIVSIWGDSREIFIITSTGTVFRSTNQGTSWSFESLPFGFQPSKIWGLGDALYVVGTIGGVEAVLRANR